MKVLVNGIGNIGTTMLGVLNQFRVELDLSYIYARKNNLAAWNQIELEILRDLGIEIVHPDYTPISNIIDNVDYIFDCTSIGHGLKNKTWYQSLDNLKGCSAQGSEQGFGIPFMTGINDESIRGSKYVQIVSCNTHSLAAILKAFAGDGLDNLAEADFVVVRRCEDIGNNQRLVNANVVSRHLNSSVGTHHAVDILDLYRCVGLTPRVTSSDITTPSQLMHSVRFNIKTINPIQTEISGPFLSSTDKFDSNVIFELGRRYGFMGRIYSHAIIVSNNLLVEKSCVKGWAFVPQEGCTILSSIHAFLLQTQHPQATELMSTLATSLIKPIW